MVSRLFVCSSPDPYVRTRFPAYKTTGPHSSVLLDKDFTTGFSLKLSKFLEHLFLYNISGRLLLNLQVT